MEVGDLLQHKEPITEESKSDGAILLTSMRSSKNKWILLNAPSDELRRRDPEQWNEILFALGDSEDGTRTTTEDGDIIFESSDVPPATLIWKYTNVCNKDSKNIFGRVMMTRPFCEYLNVKRVIEERTSDPSQQNLIVRCEEVDTVATLERAIREAKDMNLSVSDAFKNLRRDFKRKERKHAFRKNACLGDRVVLNNNKITVNEMFPILSSNHIDGDPIVHIMYLKFHRLEDELGVFKDAPQVVVNSNSKTFRTGAAKLIRVRKEKTGHDVRIYQWTEVMTFRFTGPEWMKSQNDLDFVLMDSSRKVKCLKKKWNDFKATSAPDNSSDQNNITELEFSDSSGDRAGTLHVSVSLYSL